MDALIINKGICLGNSVSCGKLARNSACNSARDSPNIPPNIPNVKRSPIMSGNSGDANGRESPIHPDLTRPKPFNLMLLNPC